jgi:hypothetical protein
MKTNWLIILFVFITTSAFNIGNRFEFKNPSINIQIEKSITKQNSRVIIFYLNFYSNENLKKLKINPSIKGANDDSQIDFVFDENSHQGTMCYYYVVPSNFDSSNKITLTFTLEDSNKVIEKKEIISL